ITCSRVRVLPRRDAGGGDEDGVNTVRLNRFLVVATIACALIAPIAAVGVMVHTSVFGHKAAFTTHVVESALGSRTLTTSTTRPPVRGLKVKIRSHGFVYNAGHDGTVALSSVDVTGGPTSAYANGTLRHTSFGSEAITVNSDKAEQFLTVDRKLGTRTWR